MPTENIRQHAVHPIPSVPVVNWNSPRSYSSRQTGSSDMLRSIREKKIRRWNRAVNRVALDMVKEERCEPSRCEFFFFILNILKSFSWLIFLINRSWYWDRFRTIFMLGSIFMVGLLFWHFHIASLLFCCAILVSGTNLSIIYILLYNYCFGIVCIDEEL